MKLSEFQRHLLATPEHQLQFILPDGDLIPAHAHITEVGRIDKTFIDCGGSRRSLSTCQLQAWVAENDEEHRFAPGKLANVLTMATPLFKGDDLEVEIEFEDCLISQFPVLAATVEDGILSFHLGAKHTECLAKEACGLTAALPGAGCCGGNC